MSAVRQIDHGVEVDLSLNTATDSNEEAVRRIVELYTRPGAVVCDPTFGRGAFWKLVNTDAYLMLCSDLKDGVDLRALPYAEDSVDLFVLDPPYRYTPAANQPHGSNGPHGEVAGLYGLASAPTRTQGVIELYREGMREAHRVLRDGGVLTVKCQDTVQDGRQIWVHTRLMQTGEDLGFAVRDLVVVTPSSVTRSRWARQRHLRKAHSYFLVFRKGGHFPFGIKSHERRSATSEERP